MCKWLFLLETAFTKKKREKYLHDIFKENFEFRYNNQGWKKTILFNIKYTLLG